MIKKGYTLIELLIVIAIIGILTAMSFFAFNNSRIAARDAKRKVDLESIRTGLEIYHSDCNKYPPTLIQPFSLSGDGSSTGCALANKYISTQYADPVSGWTYKYTSVGTGYTLCASLEQLGGTGTCNYTVTNP